MNVFLDKFVRSHYGKPGKALDLGAGQLRDVRRLKRLGWDCEGVDILTGVDLEKPYLSLKAPFDLVFSNYLLHKLKNKKQLIHTAFRNLKKGGRFFLHTFHRSDRQGSSRLTNEAVREMFKGTGFKNIKICLRDVYDREPGHRHWHKVLEATARKP